MFRTPSPLWPRRFFFLSRPHTISNGLMTKQRGSLLCFTVVTSVLLTACNSPVATTPPTAVAAPPTAVVAPPTVVAAPPTASPAQLAGPLGVVQQYFYAFNRRDVAAVFALLTDDAVWQNSMVQGPGTDCAIPCTGKAAIQKGMEVSMFYAPFTDITAQAAGNTVVTSGRGTQAIGIQSFEVSGNRISARHGDAPSFTAAQAKVANSPLVSLRSAP